MKTQSSSSRIFVFLIGWLAFALSVFPDNAWAACRAWTGTPPFTISITMASEIVMPRDAEVGEVFYVSPPTNGPSQNIAKIICGPSSALGMLDMTGGGRFVERTYRIGSSNVGYRWSHNGGDGIRQYPELTSVPRDSEYYFEGTHAIQLVKLGPLTEPVSYQGAIASYHYEGLGAGYQLSTNAFTVISGACQAHDLDIDLETHSIFDMGGVGSTIGGKDSEILLTNCSEGITLSYQLDPMTSIAPGVPSVLLPEEFPTSARGIGIQISNPNLGMPIDLGVKKYFGITTATTRIPIRAAIYKLNDNVTAGNIRAAVQFTIFYE